MYWALFGLMRSLKSSHKEALRELFCVRIIMTSQAQLATKYQIINQSDKHIAISVVYDTFLEIPFWAFVSILLNPSF